MRGALILGYGVICVALGFVFAWTIKPNKVITGFERNSKGQFTKAIKK